MLARIYPYFPLIGILIIATILRFLFLDRIPVSITGDELNYLWVSKFVGLTGSDVFGGWKPLSVFLFSYPAAFSQAELPYFLIYPSVNIFGFSLFSTRFVYAILSVATVFVIYLLARQLFDNKVALIAAALAAINPWQIFIGRTTYEMVPCMFFYLLGIYILLKAKGAYILLSLPIFIFAFYSYIGTKVAFIPILIIVSFYAWTINKKRYTKFYIAINIIALIFVTYFALSLLGNGGGRSSEVFTPFSSEISEQVDVFRRDSIAPESLNKIFENKFINYTRIIFAKTLNIFSPDYLFFQTDHFVALIRHGLFYYIDLVFLLFGAAFLYFKKKSIFAFLIALIFAGALPEILYKDRVDIFSPHLALFLTFLIFPIAAGVNYLASLDKKKNLGKILIGVYLILAANFFYLYFFQYPISGQSDLGTRILSKYLSVNESRVKVYIKVPDDAFKKHIYYEDLLNENSVGQIKNAIKSGEFKVNNLTFTECGNIGDSVDEDVVAIYNSALCEVPESNLPYLKISHLSDSGETFRIYNDKVCGKYNLGSYIENLNLADFDLKNLSEEDFCRTFITR